MTLLAQVSRSDDDCAYNCKDRGGCSVSLLRYQINVSRVSEIFVTNTIYKYTIQIRSMKKMDVIKEIDDIIVKNINKFL